MPKYVKRCAVLIALFSMLFPVVTMSAGAQQVNPDQTLNITFVACPEGGDESGPPDGCTQVVEAPASAMVTAAPDSVQPVREMDRNTDGSYSVAYLSGDSTDPGMGLVGFYSPNFNYFTFDGVDEITRWYGRVTLGDNEASRDITVSYWNGPNGLIMPAENELVVNVATCDEGIDPAVDASACVPTDAELPNMYIGAAPLSKVRMDEHLARDGGTLNYTGLPQYTQAQVVTHEPLAGYSQTLVTGQAEVIEDNGATAFLLRGETRVIDVYFYAPDGSATVVPTDNTTTDTGTLRLALLSCPAGVVPHDDPGRCTEVLTDDGTAKVTYPESGESVPLTSFDRDESGAYLVTDVQGSVTISGILPTVRDRIASDADEIHDDEIVYRVEAGQTRDGRLYYFDEP